MWDTLHSSLRHRSTTQIWQISLKKSHKRANHLNCAPTVGWAPRLGVNQIFISILLQIQCNALWQAKVKGKRDSNGQLEIISEQEADTVFISCLLNVTSPRSNVKMLLSVSPQFQTLVACFVSLNIYLSLFAWSTPALLDRKWIWTCRITLFPFIKHTLSKLSFIHLVWRMSDFSLKKKPNLYLDEPSVRCLVNKPLALQQQLWNIPATLSVRGKWTTSAEFPPVESKQHMWHIYWCLCHLTQRDVSQQGNEMLSSPERRGWRVGTDKEIPTKTTGCLCCMLKRCSFGNGKPRAERSNGGKHMRHLSVNRKSSRLHPRQQTFGNAFWVKSRCS